MHHEYLNSKLQFMIGSELRHLSASPYLHHCRLLSVILEIQCVNVRTNMCYVMLVLISRYVLNFLQLFRSALCNLIGYAWSAIYCDLLLGFERGGPVLVSSGSKFLKGAVVLMFS